MFDAHDLSVEDLAGELEDGLPCSDCEGTGVVKGWHADYQRNDYRYCTECDVAVKKFMGE